VLVALSLTMAQAKLAMALIGGCGLEDYALDDPARGKWLLSGLMQRMDCRRRDQLVGKLVKRLLSRCALLVRARQLLLV
jgi:hypothetical protein